MVEQKIKLAKHKLSIHLKDGETSDLSIFEAAHLMDQINFTNQENGSIDNLLLNYSLN